MLNRWGTCADVRILTVDASIDKHNDIHIDRFRLMKAVFMEQ